jgi:hypothetical protein
VNFSFDKEEDRKMFQVILVFGREKNRHDGERRKKKNSSLTKLPFFSYGNESNDYTVLGI